MLHLISSSCHLQPRHCFLIHSLCSTRQSCLQKDLNPSVRLSPPLICGLCDVSHVISHPFPCGRTLLSHPTSPISPPPPLITAPPRFVQGTRYPDLPPSAFQLPPCVPHVCCCGAASALFPSTSPSQQSPASLCTSRLVVVPHPTEAKILAILPVLF